MYYEVILAGSLASASTAIVVFFLTKKMVSDKIDIYTNEAKARAKAIEHEAELMLHKAKLEIQERDFEAKRRQEEEMMRIKAQEESSRCELEKKEHAVLRKLEEQRETLARKDQQLSVALERVQEEHKFNEKELQNYQARADEAIKLLEKEGSMTKSEAQEALIEQVKMRCQAELANKTRKVEEENRQALQHKAAYILAQATTRFAGEFASERLVNSVALPNDELKGRIIGKEGRNIKALEHLLGVDIIIDDTPNMIELSSHNLYRRAIATRVIELLIEDGRIQPARIEEIYAKVKSEFETGIQAEGEQIIMDLGLSGIHPDIIKLIGKLRYRASYGQNALAHTLEVAHFAGVIAAELGGDELLARRAGLLHDIGKALTHEIGGNHVDTGAEVCRKYSESPVVINAIYAHHDREEVKSIECAAVCAADALSAARPGARREVLESFLKRVKAIETIALSKEGVKHAYAINAGREVRVILNAQAVNEAQAQVMANEIAGEIEKNLQYPGDVKVHVVREERFVAIAS